MISNYELQMHLFLISQVPLIRCRCSRINSEFTVSSMGRKLAGELPSWCRAERCFLSRAPIIFSHAPPLCAWLHDCGPVMCCNLSSLTNMCDLSCLFWRLQTAPRYSGWGLPFSSSRKNPIKKKTKRTEELFSVYIYNSIFIQMDSLIWICTAGLIGFYYSHLSPDRQYILSFFIIIIIIIPHSIWSSCQVRSYIRKS